MILEIVVTILTIFFRTIVSNMVGMHTQASTSLMECGDESEKLQNVILEKFDLFTQQFDNIQRLDAAVFFIAAICVALMWLQYYYIALVGYIILITIFFYILHRTANLIQLVAVAKALVQAEKKSC